MSIKISVCVPMYNESAVIEKTARALDAYMRQKFGEDNYEVLFSDDGSRDGCGDIVRSLKLPNVRVTGFSDNYGKGHAVRTAFLEAKGDIVMFTDADLAYGVEVIGRAYDTLQKDADAEVLIGSRNLTRDGYAGYSAFRKLASKTYIRVLCIEGGFRLSDSQCGCKAFRRGAVQKIFPRCEVNGFAFDFEAILWATKFGMKIVEMPVKMLNHSVDSKVHMVRDTIKMLKDLRKMRKRIAKAQI